MLAQVTRRHKQTGIGETSADVGRLIKRQAVSSKIMVHKMLRGKISRDAGRSGQKIWVARIRVQGSGCLVQTGKETVWNVFQMIKQSLKVTRWLTGNQCKSRRMTVELTVQGACATTLANTFCIRCSLFMLACDIWYCTLLQQSSLLPMIPQDDCKHFHQTT